MSRLLPDDRSKSILRALVLGAASSSCSYAAVALARSVFRKGADFTAAMSFEMASTNLVLELSIILTVLMGWRFTLAEFAGAPIMVLILVLLFRRFLSSRLLREATAQAQKGVTGRMEGHAEMDMSVSGRGNILAHSVAARFYDDQPLFRDGSSGVPDIAGGLIAGAIGAGAARFLARFLCGTSVARKASPLSPLVSVMSRLSPSATSDRGGAVELRHQLRRRGCFIFADRSSCRSSISIANTMAGR
jgi:uncharacterized membrane protein YraQ (UPF0718 family)